LERYSEESGVIERERERGRQRWRRERESREKIFVRRYKTVRVSIIYEKKKRQKMNRER